MAERETQTQAEGALRCADPSGPGQLVRQVKGGGAIPAENTRRDVGSGLDRAGVNRVTLHTLSKATAMEDEAGLLARQLLTSSDMPDRQSRRTSTWVARWWSPAC
jgi:hypothetical protein